MDKRFVSIWFRHLRTDWFSIRQPLLKSQAFVLRRPDHGRMMVSAANEVAEQQGIQASMTLADARAMVPHLQVEDDLPDLPEKLLRRLAEWCIRFTPVVAIDLPDGLLLDATGCAHLWGGEMLYLQDIERRLQQRGYDVRIAMADTVTGAWGVARFGTVLLVPPHQLLHALQSLPPEALRLDSTITERLHSLGLHTIGQLLPMPRSSLRRRLGPSLLMQLDRATGHEWEFMEPVVPPEPYQERLPCLEPIVTPTGIAIALEALLKALCRRLQQEQKGLRAAVFKCYRVDGKILQIDIGTNRPTHHVQHVMKLFSMKLPALEPGMGIELFVLETPNVEDQTPEQERMWESAGGLQDPRLAELLDRVAVRVGQRAIHRFVPQEHYWPERSYSSAPLQAPVTTIWRDHTLRPLHMLPVPEPIEVTSPIPDYPPMLFRHRNTLHKITRADGPERIEQEWWLQQGQHRDYYVVEDEDGNRYWLFRSGHYHDKTFQWFLHGFFA